MRQLELRGAISSEPTLSEPQIREWRRLLPVLCDELDALESAEVLPGVAGEQADGVGNVRRTADSMA